MDDTFMRAALKEAEKAYEAGEVPVGAVLVHEGRIIARSYNQVESLQDATAHAEMLVMTMGASYFSNWRLLKTTLYCTLEPCVMCAGAMLLSRVSKLVWGAKDIRHGACGSFINLFEKNHPTHTIEIEGGLMELESAALMQKFFRERREK
jgi:tRNA(adenine34) deaminase